MAFATVAQLESRWRDLTTDEEAQAEVLLEDASAMLAALVDVDEADEGQAALLCVVCCNMVHRVMAQSESDAYGVSQATMTAGPYTQNVSYSNPSGDFFLTGFEKRLLGVGAPYIGSIPVSTDWGGPRD